ncbi:hypothetical protein SH203_00646 [Brevundimonas sp. SH203]|uniref:DUF6249 domain-containing protein n=1 Tax=Brevundimonas sp. SH203 TaxID=345167 RepID=UPI0009CBB89E|nr:DUF6249 domain-containing protein [Brevundimonas sp. SH203]GAW40249.1 hypothetical protein SH203_00646 [Brevundimonas sp. SH203]
MEDLVPLFAIFAVFGTITAIVFGPSYLKYREKRDMQVTVRQAVDKGLELPPELLDAMTKDVERSLPSRTKDIRKGVLSLAAGVGIAGFGIVVEGATHVWGGNGAGAMLGIACIPAAIGIAFIVLGFFNPNKA